MPASPRGSASRSSTSAVSATATPDEVPVAALEVRDDLARARPHTPCRRRRPAPPAHGRCARRRRPPPASRRRRAVRPARPRQRAAAYAAAALPSVAAGLLHRLAGRSLGAPSPARIAIFRRADQPAPALRAGLRVRRQVGVAGAANAPWSGSPGRAARQRLVLGGQRGGQVRPGAHQRPPPGEALVLGPVPEPDPLLADVPAEQRSPARPPPAGKSTSPRSSPSPARRGRDLLDRRPDLRRERSSRSRSRSASRFSRPPPFEPIAITIRCQRVRSGRISRSPSRPSARPALAIERRAAPPPRRA